MQIARRLTIAIIGTSDTVTPEIRMAWLQARIGFEGPYAASLVDIENKIRFSAAIIDVRYEADVMLRLTERLEKESIPYLFFVPETLFDSKPGPFVLSARLEDRETIVAALFAQGGARH